MKAFIRVKFDPITNRMICSTCWNGDHNLNPDFDDHCDLDGEPACKCLCRGLENQGLITEEAGNECQGAGQGQGHRNAVAVRVPGLLSPGGSQVPGV